VIELEKQSFAGPGSGLHQDDRKQEQLLISLELFWFSIDVWKKQNKA